MPRAGVPLRDIFKFDAGRLAVFLLSFLVAMPPSPKCNPTATRTYI
jgi:hypothetical protein